ncbi:MAG: acetyl-CoA carboxylase carboxyltransferase subunit alpha, partial [Bacteroidales bacterium]|nr:acetyl-CoA carboxylase carboxyltransferase subunit alpha [Bacteroidales bacterium]
IHNLLYINPIINYRLHTMETEKSILEIKEKIEELKERDENGNTSLSSEINEYEIKLRDLMWSLHLGLSPWEIVQLSRHPERPVLQDYLELIFKNFVEFRGDRYYSDDRAIIGGFAEIGDQKIMLIGHNKGKNTEENVERNFGMSRPEGYRKALRLMKLAERFTIPIVTFIDTPGAFPGLEAEERGQAEAIARNITEMTSIEVPIISVVIGEGGSGGALGIGVGDKILMLSNAIYSVISPEGCASILWRDAKYAADAAAALNLTANSLLNLNVIDEIIKEPSEGAHANYQQTANAVKKSVIKNIKKLKGLSANELIETRFRKYSKIGKFSIVG